MGNCEDKCSGMFEGNGRGEGERIEKSKAERSDKLEDELKKAINGIEQSGEVREVRKGKDVVINKKESSNGKTLVQFENGGVYEGKRRVKHGR